MGHKSLSANAGNIVQTERSRQKNNHGPSAGRMPSPIEVEETQRRKDGESRGNTDLIGFAFPGFGFFYLIKWNMWNIRGKTRNFWSRDVE
jgi:hypothetical protein